MKSCAKCGTQNLDPDNFCKECASPLPSVAARTCPSGRHTMDPSWTECVYCRQESASQPARRPAARMATVVEGQEAPRTFQTTPGAEAGVRPPVPPRLPPRPVNPPPPVGNAPPARPARSHTVYAPSTPAAGGAQAVPAAPKNRKIVGMLITYSWLSDGQIFPVREGRNLIGRDKDCEICVSEDQTLSGRNSHITYRQNFVIGDLVSMTGTDLNGTPIEEQFHALGNYAEIRAGSTYFTFIAISPASANEPAGDTKPQ